MVRKLSDILEERGRKVQDQKDRAQYRAAGVEIPLELWTSNHMLSYFMRQAKRAGSKLKELQDQRSKIQAMSAIKNMRLNGRQFVELVDFVDKGDGLTTIWFLIRKAKEWKEMQDE